MLLILPNLYKERKVLVSQLKCQRKCFGFSFHILFQHFIAALQKNPRSSDWALGRLVHLLDGRSSTASSSSSAGTRCTTHASHVRHTSWHSSWGTTSVSIQLGDDWVAHPFHLLLLLVELLHLGELVGVQPLNGLVTLVGDSLAVVLADLVLHLVVVQGSLHVEAVALQSVLGRDPVLLLVVLSLELLSVIDHPLDFLLGESALVVGDRDLVLLSSGLVSSRDVQDTIGINVKGHLNLWNPTGRRGNTSPC